MKQYTWLDTAILSLLYEWQMFRKYCVNTWTVRTPQLFKCLFLKVGQIAPCLCYSLFSTLVVHRCFYKDPLSQYQGSGCLFFPITE